MRIGRRKWQRNIHSFTQGCTVLGLTDDAYRASPIHLSFTIGLLVSEANVLTTGSCEGYFRLQVSQV